MQPFDINSEENPSFMVRCCLLVHCSSPACLPDSHECQAWNWYPETPQDTTGLPPRLHAHADMDVITLLFQRPGKHMSLVRACCVVQFWSLWYACRRRRPGDSSWQRCGAQRTAG